MPKVSIILPVYNVEPYLRKALDSVVNQTLRDIEIICINDCSPDNSLAILEEYAQRDSRIKIINQETNQGQGVARNLGIDMAIGEYLTFLDPDDWFELNACELLYNTARDNNAKVVRAAYTMHYLDNDKVEYVDYRKVYEKRDGIKIPDNDFFDVRSEKNFIFYFTEQYPCFHLYLTSFIKDNNFRFAPYRKAEDHVFVIDVKLSTPIFQIGDSIYNYLIRKDSSVSYPIMYEEIINSIRTLRDTKYKNDEYAQGRLNNYILRRYNLKYRKLYNSCFPTKFLKEHKGQIEPEVYSILVKKVWSYYIKQVLKTIFSLRSEKRNGMKHKIVTVFGLKIKFKVKKNPKKLFKKAVKNHWQSAQKAHQETIKRLQEEVKHRKLRVCFLVQETQKWNAQSLYDEMEKSDIFEPFVVVTRLPNNDYRNSFEHNVEFFKQQCKNVEIGFDEVTETPIDIKSFKPDIVFYQQPWALFENQNPDYILGTALSYYFSYAIGDAPSCLQNLLGKFFLKLYRYFVFSKEEEKQYGSVYGYKKYNMVAIGHPKLDVFKDYQEANYEHKYVIYAPHHSFGKKSLQYGTFEWNGKYILEWAKAHPEFHWLFKPHPRLKVGLLNANIMTEKEIEDYYNEWAKIGSYYDDGSYFDLFKNSKCLITDCGSFLTEYLPTRQPIIHLRNPKSRDFAASNVEIMKSFYKAWNLKDLKKHLDNVLLKGLDPSKERRIRVMKKFGLENPNTTQKIIDVILKDLNIK